MNYTENVTDFDALYSSMLKCKNGVLWKSSVAHFYLHGIEECLKLEKQLKSGTYRSRRPKKILITCPKKREAIGIAFRDRVYQRSLNDNALYPCMTRPFIHANMACQKGKGTDAARGLLARYMRREFSKYEYDCYVLQCDVHKYYPNMRHKVTEDVFRRYTSKDIYQQVKSILTHQYDGDVGYYPGSQMVQIAGISVLSPMDHYIKEKLHIKSYIRYMDDFILMHHDRSYLEECRQLISDYLNSIGFELHPEKTRIYPIKDGIRFLGFTHHVTPTGKVIRIIDPANVKAERKRLRHMVHLTRKGMISREKADECFVSWKAHASKGNSFHLIQRMEAYYKNLLEGME